MIIFLYGPDTYRSRQKLNEIIKKHKEQNARVAFRFLNLKKDSFEDLRNETETISMFKEKKTTVITEAFSDSETEEKVLQFLKEKKELDDTLIFYEEAVDKKKSLYKFLKKQKEVQEFKLLEGGEVRNWVKKEFGKYQREIDSMGLEILARATGNDLWRASNEIRKLVAYSAKNSSPRISSEDVKMLIKPEIEPEIFQTIDAIASGDKKRAMVLLHQHLEKGDSPIYLLSRIRWQFSNLLSVKDLTERRKPFSEIIKITALHPFVVKKSYALSQRFEMGQLKKIYRKIFQLEIKIKTGKIEPGLALDLLIAGV